MLAVITIALPAELAERLDKFVAQTGGTHEQIALEMLERGLSFSVTPSEHAEMEAQFAEMATDEDYQRTLRELENEGWV